MQTFPPVCAASYLYSGDRTPLLMWFFSGQLFWKPQVKGLPWRDSFSCPLSKAAAHTKHTLLITFHLLERCSWQISANNKRIETRVSFSLTSTWQKEESMHAPQKWSIYPGLCEAKPQDWRQRAEGREEGRVLREALGQGQGRDRHCWPCWELLEAWGQPGSWFQLLSSRILLKRSLTTAINLASHCAHVEAETSDSKEGSWRQGFGTGRQQLVQSYMLFPVMWQKQYSVTEVASYMYFLGSQGGQWEKGDLDEEISF